MLDKILLAHLAVQCGRAALVVGLFAALAVYGAAAERLLACRIDSPGSALLTRVALGFGLYAALVRTLGVFGAARGFEALALLAAALPLGALFRLWPQSPTWKRWWLERPGGFPGVILFVLALLPLGMALAPAVSFDAMVYQLRFPELTLATGRWAIDFANSPSFFPSATGALYLASLAADSAGVCAQLVHYVFFLLTLAAIALLGRRWGGEKSGWFAALVFASAPVAPIVAGWSWSDLSLCFSLAASCLALAEGAVPIALACLGTAAAVKYSGALLAVPIAVWFLAAPKVRRSLSGIARGLLLGAIIAAPWYVSNFRATGNPVYPLMPRFFGGAATSSENLLQWQARTGPPGRSAITSYLFSPPSLDADLGGAPMATLFLAVLVLALARRRFRVLALVLLAGTAPLLLYRPAARILLPGVAAFAIIAGIATSSRDSPRAVRAITGALAVALGVRGAFVVAAHNSFVFDPIACAAGIESEEAYRNRILPFFPLFRRAERELEKGAVVLSVGEPRLFRFPARAIASSEADPPAIRPYLAAAAPETIRRLRSRGVTHLLVRGKFIATAGEAPAVSGLTESESGQLRAVLRGCALLDRADDLLLFALPKPEN